MRNLESAIQNVFEVFSVYTLNGGLRDRSCKCCVSQEEIRELVSKPMNELSVDEIGHFMRSAISTFGDVDDLKHFLPRILELFQDPSYDLVDDFLTFEKLNYAEWETWNAEEIEAVDNYILALWAAIISNESSTISKIEKVPALIAKYVGIEKALQIWKNKCSKKSIKLIVEHSLNGKNIGLSESDLNTFWNWISNKTVLKKMEELFFESNDEIESSRISVAYTLIERNKNENKNIK